MIERYIEREKETKMEQKKRDKNKARRENDHRYRKLEKG